MLNLKNPDFACITFYEFIKNKISLFSLRERKYIILELILLLKDYSDKIDESIKGYDSFNENKNQTILPFDT